MNLFKIIMFGILMINFGVYGQQEADLSIPEGLPYEGRAIDGQKLGEVIASEMRSLKRVFNISFQTAQEEASSLPNERRFYTVYRAIFSVETNGDRIFTNIQCNLNIIDDEFLILRFCRNRVVSFRSDIKIFLTDISDIPQPSDLLFEGTE